MKLKPPSELELKIMEIVWEQGECSARDVADVINKDKQLAYTTVATMMSRLVEKGALKKKVDGQSNLYAPTVSKKNLGKTVAKSFIGKFFQSFGEVAASSFAESLDELPNDTKEYFIKLLSEYESKNK